MTCGEHEHELALDLPAAHRGVKIARNVVRHFARMEGVRDLEIEQLVLIVSELLANAIDHGGGSAAMTEHELAGNPRMKLDLVIRPQLWVLAVTDQGGGDPERVGAALRDAQFPDVEDERGRGLFLMKQMVDSLEVFRSADGRGLTFRVSKRHGVR